jgi:hypothetical protein
MIYFNCEKTIKETIQKTKKNILDFLTCTEFKQLLLNFGHEIPDTDNIVELIEHMIGISEQWDFRQKQNTLDVKTGEYARWLVTDESITKIQYESVMNAIKQLGFINCNKPKSSNYDYILVLGGARYSCLYRTKYAIQIVNQLKEKPKAIVLLSSHRKVSDSERTATDTYAPEAVTEFDLFNGSIKSLLPEYQEYCEKRTEFENFNKSHAIRKYKSDEFATIINLSAPSSDPEKRRANSTDTYRYFAQKCNPCEEAKILLITNEIYVPYQQLEALSALAIVLDVQVETIGFPNEWLNSLHGRKCASNYLQEIRSTILAMERFINTV